jgi:hypothetical protein
MRKQAHCNADPQNHPNEQQHVAVFDQLPMVHITQSIDANSLSPANQIMRSSLDKQTRLQYLDEFVIIGCKVIDQLGDQEQRKGEHAKHCNLMQDIGHYFVQQERALYTL